MNDSPCSGLNRSRRRISIFLADVVSGPYLYNSPIDFGTRSEQTPSLNSMCVVGVRFREPTWHMHAISQCLACMHELDLPNGEGMRTTTRPPLLQLNLEKVHYHAQYLNNIISLTIQVLRLLRNSTFGAAGCGSCTACMNGT